MALQIKCIKLNGKIERMSQLIHFMLAKLTFVGCVLPDLILTTINYFIYNLNDESFHLSIPMMYVECAVFMVKRL